MKRIIGVIFFIVVVAAGNAWAQDEKPEERIAIEKLDFLVGNWAGSGWSYDENGEASEYFDTEDVWYDAQKTLLIIQARGFRENSQFYGLHTVIYYDAEAGHYWYNPYTARGARRFKCSLNDQVFTCLNEAEDYRLTFERLEGGEWSEVGKRLVGGKWVDNFRTVLTPAATPVE